MKVWHTCLILKDMKFSVEGDNLNVFVDSYNNYYITLAIIKKTAKRIGLEINQNKLRDIVLKAGGEYIKYYEEGSRKWVYKLPSGFKGGKGEIGELKVWRGCEA